MLGTRLYLEFYDEEEWDKKINKLVGELNSLGIHPGNNNSHGPHHKTSLPPTPQSPQQKLPARGPSTSNIDLTNESSPAPLSPIPKSSSSSSPSSSSSSSSSSPPVSSPSVKRALPQKPSHNRKVTPETWQVQDVCAWLKRERMDSMVDAFTKEVVDGHALKELNNMVINNKNDARLVLKDMGVNTGDFLRFCTATTALFQQ